MSGLWLGSLSLAACSLLPATLVPPDGSTLGGSALFPAGRTAQASVGDIAIAATVSLIDPVSNQTVATTLTKPDASFTLSLPRLAPAEGQLYYLEAVKGLDSNRAGNDAARIRNLVRYARATGWQAIGTRDASITLSTTTLSAIAQLRSGTPHALDPGALIGTITFGEPDAFASTGTGVSPAEYAEVLALAKQALAADRDPLASFRYSAATRTYTNVMPTVLELPAIAWLSPPAGSVGTRVAIHGVNLAKGTPQVTIGGVPATLATVADARVEVTVPAGATPGMLQLTTQVGRATASFSVTPLVAGTLDSPTTPPPSGPGTGLTGSVTVK